MLLSQQKNLQDLLIKTKMGDAKPVKSPMATNTSLTLHLGEPMFDPHLYRQVVRVL